MTRYSRPIGSVLRRSEPARQARHPFARCGRGTKGAPLIGERVGRAYYTEHGRQARSQGWRQLALAHDPASELIGDRCRLAGEIDYLPSLMSALQSWTIWIGNHRTSVRLHPSMWDALDELAERQGKTVHDVLIEIDRKRGTTSLSTSIRVYIVEFFRQALKQDSVA